MNAVLDLAGRRFGRLAVAGRDGSMGGEAAWSCVCDCGSTVTVRGYSLRAGMTMSCGCLQKEMTSKAKMTHGLRRSKTYRVWSAMRQRCSNPSNAAFNDYGARGIVVCEAWDRSFEAFLSDMGHAPAGGSIERIDNSQGYSPTNCVWSTAAAQARNKRNNVVLTVDGISMCLSDWASEIGVSRGCLRRRLANGWSHDDAVKTGVLKRMEADRKGKR